jgi:hypothetical protein
VVKLTRLSQHMMTVVAISGCAVVQVENGGVVIERRFVLASSGLRSPNAEDIVVERSATIGVRASPAGMTFGISKTVNAYVPRAERCSLILVSDSNTSMPDEILKSVTTLLPSVCVVN